jgi:hypothetical protein
MKIAALALLAAGILAAQTPSPSSQQVMAILTVRPAVTRDQIMKVMPEEVRATVKLYLDGKIQQWYSRGDGKGVMFIMNCSSAAEAKTVTDQLPLRQLNLADFEFMPLNPLTPLRVLLGESAPQK